MKDRKKLLDIKNIVIKVGTSTLTHSNGTIDPARIDKIAEVLSQLCNKGYKVILVTSGAIAVGASKIGITERPSDLPGKQALAAIGQAELINMYAKSFDQYHQIVAQVLLTKDGITNPVRRENANNTLKKLIEMNIIPIINENDTIATDEIEIGDNDTLSAYVAIISNSDLLIILSDIDGLYTDDPRKNPDATIISKVPFLTKEIEEVASGAGTSFSTGGMVTKIIAAKLCVNNNVNMVITKGDDPAIVFNILEGQDVGTLFVANGIPSENGRKNYFFFDNHI
jgi:glutamate 5-kinase